MDSVFKRKQGLGGREMIAQRKAKCSGAIEISAGRHQAVFSFDPSKDMSASAQCSLQAVVLLITYLLREIQELTMSTKN